jgi:hypothetical protein
MKKRKPRDPRIVTTDIGDYSEFDYPCDGQAKLTLKFSDRLAFRLGGSLSEIYENAANNVTAIRKKSKAGC